MVIVSPEAIPKLRRVSVPRQSGKDALVSSLAALVDRSLMRTVSFVVERRILPRDVDLDMLRESIHIMLATNLIERPQEFFHFVQKLESGNASSPARLYTRERRRIKGGKIYRRQIRSVYQHYPHLPLPESATEENDAIQFEHWVHDPDREMGSVIVLHGFAMGWPVIDAMAMSAGQWFARGFNVILLTLPDHGPRRTPGTLFSGAKFYRAPCCASGLCGTSRHARDFRDQALVARPQ